MSRLTGGVASQHRDRRDETGTANVSAVDSELYMAIAEYDRTYRQNS